MPGTGSAASLRLGLDLQEALVGVVDETFREYKMGSRADLFGGTLPITDTPFTAGGLRMRWTIERPRSTFAMGPVSSGGTPSVVPDPVGAYRYDDLQYLRAHFNDVFGVCAYDQVVADYINDAPQGQDGLQNAASKMMADILLSYKRDVAIMMITDRRNILGTIIAKMKPSDSTLLKAAATAIDPDDVTCTAPAFGYDPASGDAYNGRWEFSLYLGVDTITAAIQPGMGLWAVAKPSGYASSTETGLTLGALRTHGAADATPVTCHCTMKVLEMPELQTYSQEQTGAIMKVKVAVYYTDSTHKANVLAMIQEILPVTATVTTVGAGDVITPAGGVATTIAGSTFGPGFGLCGLLHYFTRANIEASASSGPSTTNSTALKDSQGNSLTRVEGGNASFWYPFIQKPSTYNTTQITLAAVQNVLRQLVFRMATPTPDVIPLAHELIISQLCTEVGSGAYRQTERWDGASQPRWQPYGYEGVTFHGANFKPISIGENPWVPPWGVFFLDPKDYTIMSPTPGKWMDWGTGHIWQTRRNSTAKLLMGSQAAFGKGLQMHAYTLWNQGAALYYRP
jgi:hypothetical protein